MWSRNKRRNKRVTFVNAGVGRSGLSFDRSNRENAVESPGHTATLHLFDIPVVGEPGPAQDGLDRRGPDVA